MDKIKLGFCGFWGSFKPEKSLFINILKKHFEIELVDTQKGNTPDFLICSNRGLPFEYTQFDCIRIMFMGENLSPDFTAFDYVIGFDRMQFGDRYFRLPFGLYSEKMPDFSRPTRAQAEEFLRNKKHFCNFIYGHQSQGQREAIFEKLQEYKPVVSPGRFLNNCGTKGCSWAEKNVYLKESKFTIAGDSIQYPGFMTEKVIQPLCIGSVPIYCGDPTLTTEINPECLIECRGAEYLDSMLEMVKEIDSDDKKYLDMLTAPVFRSEDYINQLYTDFEEFLVNIFCQTPEKAQRRIMHYCADNHNKSMNNYYRIYKSIPKLIRENLIK